MAVWVRVVAGVVALGLEWLVLDAAIRTFLLPRVASVRLSRLASKSVGAIFKLIAKRKSSYDERDRVLALYPSFVLLVYQGLWLALSVVAFAFGFIAAGVPGFSRAFEVSGSSLFTLGTAGGAGGFQVALSYLEAGSGLTLLALLISFIPTLYASFQRREISVSRLSVRAGVPATPWGIIEIAQSVASYDRLEELWREWEQWFTEVGETHTDPHDPQLLPLADPRPDVDRVRGERARRRGALQLRGRPTGLGRRRVVHPLGLDDPSSASPTTSGCPIRRRGSLDAGDDHAQGVRVRARPARGRGDPGARRP